MRIVFAALLTTLVVTVLTGIIGAAAAEAPSTAPLRSVSVEGVASVPIEQHASAAQADAAYRQALAGALADGKGKAEFLAGSATATLGEVQSIVEDGGYVECTSPEPSQFEYEGEQPDFGDGSSAVAPRSAPLETGAAAPSTATVVKKRKKRKHAPVRAAVAGSCRVFAQVALSYAIS